MLERYATESISPQQRIRRWCDFGSSTLSRLAVHPYDPRRFSARLSRRLIGSVGVSLTQTTPAIAVGDGRCADDWAGASGGCVSLTLQKTGSSRLLQGGRDVQLYAGDVFIRDLRNHWELDACLDSTLVSVKLPAARVARCLGDLSAFIAVPLRGGARPAALLGAVIENLARLAFERSTAMSPEAVDELVFGAVRVAYECLDAEPASEGGGARNQCQVLQFVDERLYDPEVTVAGLAAGLDMSVRSLQRIFYGRGTSPRAYILSKRLQAAADLLRNQSQDRVLRITDVAIACGFNDSGYFSRVFQLHFGMTPSEFLHRGRTGT